MHPRTAKSIKDAGLALPEGGGLRTIEPQGYLDMICLVANCRIVLTDSGGLQKEAFFLNRPCVTLREETEWVETAESGSNLVAGTDAGEDRRSCFAAGTRYLPAENRTFWLRSATPSATVPRPTQIVSQILDFLSSQPAA